MPEIVRTNPVNSPDNKPVKTHSSFKPNYTRLDSHRFGLNTPHFAMAAVADDDISMRCVADVDTMSLKAPLMVPVKRNMDYFQVPIRAILPGTAELLLTNPRTGDDIDPRMVNCVIRRPNDTGESYAVALSGMISSIEQSLRNICNSLYTIDITTPTSVFAGWLRSVISLYQVCRPLFLSSSLPKYLGYSLDKLFTIRVVLSSSSNLADVQSYTLTEFFELLFSVVNYYLNQHPTLQVFATAYKLNVGTAYSSYPYGQPSVVAANKIYSISGGQTHVVVSSAVVTLCPLAHFLDRLLEDNYYFEISASADDDWGFTSGTVSIFGIGFNALTGMSFSNIAIDTVVPSKDINISKIVAYQLASAEFYTNDRVDGVYSAKLYHDNLKMLGMMALGTSAAGYQTFSINGVAIEYDSVCAEILNRVLGTLWFLFSPSDVNDAYVTGPERFAALMYMRNLFDLTRSLRFEDYFVGARTSPLAVGDVSVGVDTQDNTVDIIDVTKNIQVQRFLNQVNRVGRKFRDYIKGIFGDIPLKDCHEPFFLGHITDTIGAEETDNTGAAQLSLPNSTTSKLRNNSARFGFEVHCSEPSVLVGITNYDIPRAYGSATDRDNFHVDRFDMFNPFLQFVGDQEVFSLELTPRIDTSTNPVFGYAGRYSEYKQRVDLAGGAFATKDALPGYAKVIDDVELPENIDSDFLRSHVTDLDEFYVSRTGIIDTYRYNFIVRCDNSVSAKRPMAFNPSIL